MSVVQGLRVAVTPEIAALDRLLFRAHDAWAPLPHWGQYLVSLGAQLHQWESPGLRAVVCVTLPTRAFSAPLAALGAIGSSVGGQAHPTDSASAHFETLARLPDGTRVVLRKKTQKLKGILRGPEERGGIRYLRVQVESLHERGGGLTEFIQEIDSQRIHPLGSETSAPALPKTQKGRPVARHATFLESLLELQDVYEFVTRSSIECAVIGSKTGLRSEIYSAGFAIRPRPPGELQEGCLQDALRVREFLAEGDGCRSVIVPASASEIQVDAATASARLAIFDGATAYLRWRQEFPGTNNLVLLDRCQPSAEDAAAAFIQEHAKRQGDFDVPEDAPRGVEVAAFVGKSR